jgi:8-oxo-dGTP pyrophosphatase MutT (NUDIX family)
MNSNEKSMSPGSDSRPTHAGAVVFRKSSEGYQFLIISSSNGRHWVLPKGHIDPGENAESTSLRELVEETGVLGRIVGFVSEQHFSTPSGNTVVHYFLVEETGQSAPLEDRKLLWVDEDIALHLLSFENTREALKQAANHLNSKDPHFRK